MHVTANSKEVRPGSIFFALKGAKFDGHDYIEDAIKMGAGTIYSERDSKIPGVIALHDQARKKLGLLASEMYQNPSHQLKMIGVTGTSGKTTTTYLIHHLLESAGIPCARLGTNGGYFQGQESETNNTTPDALSLQKWFQEVKISGAKAVVMEVSSHALQQDRVYGIAWDSAVFLNLSPEHMDYHPSLDHYFNAKALLFQTHDDHSQKMGKKPLFFAHHDHAFGARLLKENQRVAPFSVKNQVRGLVSTPSGIEGEIQIQNSWSPFQCSLFGKFQIENILAAVQVVSGLGVSTPQILAGLKSFAGVPGRMEHIPNTRGVQIFVDYAHKPEALEKVLEAVQGKRIITVFGCGGDRDKTKRPVMGEIASRLSDWVFLTSDNPRSENPMTILGEIEAGIQKKNYTVIENRRLAIQTAIEAAKTGDVVLIAGKGHENYQIVGTVKSHFDDREEAAKVT